MEGLADAIVEVTETETTIRAHGLRVIDEVLATNAVLIAGRAAWEDPVKRRKVEQIDSAASRAPRGPNPWLCLEDERPLRPFFVDAILDLLPSLNSPTVASPRDPAWGWSGWKRWSMPTWSATSSPRLRAQRRRRHTRTHAEEGCHEERAATALPQRQPGFQPGTIQAST